MVPVRGALERFLTAHKPYPAPVVDRYCNIAASNRGVAYVTRGGASSSAPRRHRRSGSRCTQKGWHCVSPIWPTGAAAELTIVAFYPANSQTAEALSSGVGWLARRGR